VLSKVDLSNSPQSAAEVDQVRSKIQKFDHFLSTNIEDLVALSQDYSVFDKQSVWQDDNAQDLSVSPIGTQSTISLVELNLLVGRKEQVLNYPALDYAKLTESIITSKNDNYQRSILQALRWRVTRTYGLNIRRAVVLAMSEHDILGLRRMPSPMIDALFIKGSVKLKESTARFVNALSSDYLGRSYLVESEPFIKLLIKILKTEVMVAFISRLMLPIAQRYLPQKELSW
jgi:hypothetical protein